MSPEPWRFIVEFGCMLCGRVRGRVLVDEATTPILLPRADQHCATCAGPVVRSGNVVRWRPEERLPPESWRQTAGRPRKNRVEA